MEEYSVSDGYVERKAGGSFEGDVCVEGINLSPIVATYFQSNGENYLWLKRKPLLEYDMKTQSYKQRNRKPSWECYLKKQIDGGVVAYKGEFAFLRFRFSITGVWDRVLGTDKKNRLNLFVTRLPMSQQTIINNINERRKKGL